MFDLKDLTFESNFHCMNIVITYSRLCTSPIIGDNPVQVQVARPEQYYDPEKHPVMKRGLKSELQKINCTFWTIVVMIEMR